MARTKKGKKTDTAREKLWEVDQVLARRRNHINDQVEYLVQWKGWRADRSTWEPERNLTPELQERMRQRFTDKYDYYVIPHVKQPRKQTRIVSPNASPIRISTTAVDHGDGSGPSTSNKSESRRVELKNFSINIEAKTDIEVIEEMKQKGIFLMKRGHWDYDVTVSSMSDEEEHEPDDDECVPTSKRERPRKSRRSSVSSGAKYENTNVKSTKTVTKSRSTKTVTKSRSTRGKRRSRTAEEIADEQTREFLSEFVNPVIGLEDCVDQGVVDSFGDDEEVIVTLDVDELEKMLPKPFMESLDPLLCLTPSSEPLSDPMNPMNPLSTASSSTPVPSMSEVILKPKSSSVTTNEVKVDSKISSTSPVDATYSNRSSRKGSKTQVVTIEEPVNKRSSTDPCSSGQSKKSKAVSDFESQLNSIDKKVEKKPKSTRELMREVRRRTVGGEEAAKSTQQQQVASLPVEQVVKPDIIKLEKKNVGMLVDPKAKKESSSLSSLKEKLREARMKNLPVEPCEERCEERVTDPIAVVETGDGGGDGWEDDGWNDAPTVPKAAPMTMPSVTPVKPVTKPVKTASSSKVNKSTTIQSMGKRSSKVTKPLAGQSGQNSVKKSKFVLKPLALSGFRIPKKVASKEISSGPSENLEDEWGTPFRPEVVKDEWGTPFRPEVVKDEWGTPFRPEVVKIDSCSGSATIA